MTSLSGPVVAGLNAPIIDIGACLRDARERRGLTLRDVAATTKIATRALDAIERNDFAHLPGGIFRRAYVHAFATAVGLDADQVTRQYRAGFEPEADVDDLGSPVPLSDRSVVGPWLVGALAAVAALLLYAFLLWSSGESGREPEAEAASARVTVVDTLVRAAP